MVLSTQCWRPASCGWSMSINFFFYWHLVYVATLLKAWTLTWSFEKSRAESPLPRRCTLVCQQFTFRSVLSLRQKLRCTWRLVKSCFGVLAVHRVFGRCGCSTQVRQFCLGWDTELGLAAQRTQSGSSPISHLGVHAAQLCLVCCSSTVGHSSLRVLCLEHWCASLMAETVTSYVLQHILFENIYLIITTL